MGTQAGSAIMALFVIRVCANFPARLARCTTCTCCVHAINCLMVFIYVHANRFGARYALLNLGEFLCPLNQPVFLASLQEQ